jgi:hypothetical protein
MLEDGPELPRSFDPHAEEEGEGFEGMYTQGCTKIEKSRLYAYSGMAVGVRAVSG